MRCRQFLSILSFLFAFSLYPFSAHAQSVLSAAGGYTCLNKSGDAYCWGDSDNGVTEIGRPPWLRSRFPKTVVDSSGMQLHSIASIAAGASHTCAILHATRDVFCWGSNDHGVLGNESTIDSLFPV